VGELAGLPRPVIHRAQEILAELEREGREPQAGSAEPAGQLSFLTENHPLMRELRGLDVDSLTPLEALNKLFEWQRRLADDDRSDSR